MKTLAALRAPRRAEVAAAVADNGIDVEILDPREGQEPGGWAKFRRIVAPQPMWDYGLLRLEAWLSRNPPVLALMREGGRVLGACVVMLCDPMRGSVFAPGPSARGSRLSPRWAEVYLPWFSGHPAVVFRERVDAASRRELLRIFERRLAEYAGPGLLGVIYRAMPSDIAELVAGRGRARREIDPTTVLHNRFDSVEEWVGSLRAPVRAVVRDALGRFDSLDVTAGKGRKDLDAAELAALLNEHRARQDARAWRSGQRARIAGLHLDTRSPIPTAYLAEFLRRPTVLTRTYREPSGRLVAFQAMFDTEYGLAMPYWAALPRQQGGLPRLHLDGYAHAVRELIDSGRPELTAGRTLLDLKADLGFTTRTLHSVAVPRPVMGR
ncbi:hypothetical protein SAXI111661_16535 [Saccharomonospora xinjiangensis]|uniref:hypothetical protein n=1 Tax=Saccharomonospora xinjiangensis TaxID=75294 RepID=UPI00106F4A7C|nr:hypothetical protein [Saccharomonospora xinjiangensis]QBQ62480.1 hypothetical protein EYD13_20755 [Saccharomonospora xinjiangensis]